MIQGAYSQTVHRKVLKIVRYEFCKNFSSIIGKKHQDTNTSLESFVKTNFPQKSCYEKIIFKRFYEYTVRGVYYKMFLQQ